MSLDTQIDLLLEVRRMCERGTTWLLRNLPPPLDIDAAIATFAAGIATLSGSLETSMAGRVADRHRSDIAPSAAPSVSPIELAAHSARWPWMHTAFDMVRLAQEEGCDVDLGSIRLRRGVRGVRHRMDVGRRSARFPRSDRWQTQARSSMRDDLMNVIAELTRRVMRSDGGSTQRVDDCEPSVPSSRTVAMHQEIRRAESFDLTTLSVALRQLRNLTTAAAG